MRHLNTTHILTEVSMKLTRPPPLIYADRHFIVSWCAVPKRDCSILKFCILILLHNMDLISWLFVMQYDSTSVSLNNFWFHTWLFSLHTGHLIMYRLRTRVTSPSRHCLQKMCWQVNTFGSVNFSRQIEHSRCSSKSSFEVVIIYISFWKKTFIHNTFIRHQTERKNQNNPGLDIGIGRKITLLRAKWPDTREEGYSFREGRPVLCVCNINLTCEVLSI